MVEGQGAVAVPSTLAEAGQVDGKAFIGEAVGEKCQKTAGDAGEMDGQGLTHQQMPQVDHKHGGNDCHG